MSDVYIDSLKIKNFGPYYGEHNFDFGVSDKRRVILIGGKNGVGKTHLLRAIYLAVVGKSAEGDLKKLESGSDATKFSLLNSLNRRAKLEGDNESILEITLSQRDRNIPDGVGRTLKLIRQIKYRDNSPPIINSEAIDGSNIISDEDKIQTLRDAFLPRHLARFFFFDAERGQSIRLNEDEIIEGISRVLGLYSYSELEQDLRQLTATNGKIAKTYGSGTEQEIHLNDIQGQILRTSKDIEVLSNEYNEKQQKLSDIEDELETIEDNLKDMGAIDPIELAKLQHQRDDIKDAKSNLQNNLQDAWERLLPIALLGEYRNILHDYLEAEERRREWEQRRSSVEPKIPQVKSDVFENSPNEFKLSENTKKFYENQLEKALERLFNPPPEGMSETVFVIPDRKELSIQVRLQLTSHMQGISNLVETSTELNKKIIHQKELEQRLKYLQPDPHTVEKSNQLREKRGELLQQKQSIDAGLNEINSRKTQLENNLKELKRQESNLSKDVEKLKQGRDLASLANTYRNAVSEIKQRAATQLRDKISDIVGGIWLDITDRGMEYNGLHFDKKWNCFLQKLGGEMQKWEDANTSAGQRQVRILAFTEALRRLAKIVPPLVVDTPLGRLDKEVKQSVLEQLYVAGHQSIVLSTNSEIEPNTPLFEGISSKLSKVYTLNPVGDISSKSYHVDVSNDYFKRVL